MENSSVKIQKISDAGSKQVSRFKAKPTTFNNYYQVD